MIETNGTIAAHYQYDSFGNTIAQFDIQAPANKFRFSTKYWDIETRLYYYGFRFYIPEIGRWGNLDPVGLNGGRNLYGVAFNNFVDFVDYLGLACCCKKLNIFTRPGSGKTLEDGVGITIQPKEISITVEFEGNSDECKCTIKEQAWNGITRDAPYYYEERQEENFVAFNCFLVVIGVVFGHRTFNLL